MTGRIFALKRFAVHDGPGVRTTLFLKGCPLRCVWCHNPEGLEGAPSLALYREKCIGCGACLTLPCRVHRAEEGVHTLLREKCIGCGACARQCPSEALVHYGEVIDSDRASEMLLEDRAFYEEGGGITLSGGECLLQAEFCRELLSRMKREGIHTAVDTAGDVPFEAFDTVLPYTDLFLYDIKAIDSDVHLRCTGRTNERILSNFRALLARGARVEVRVPYVPEWNESEMLPIARYLANSGICRVRILPFHPFAGSKYTSLGMKSHMPERIPDPKQTEQVRELFRSFGLCVGD